MNSIDYIKHHFDFESPQPPGMQLAVVVAETIKAGVLTPGDPLPTERELCDALLLPRSAVREAMEILRTSGEITRMAGLGTFVAPSFMRRQLDSVYDFTRSVKAEGMEPSTKVLLFQHTYPAGFSSRTLDLPLDEPSIFRIERLRYADDVPMSLEIEHIPCLRFPNLTQAPSMRCSRANTASRLEMPTNTTRPFFWASARPSCWTASTEAPRSALCAWCATPPARYSTSPRPLSPAITHALACTSKGAPRPRTSTEP